MATAASSGLNPQVIPVWPIFSRRLGCAEARAPRAASPPREINVRRSIWWDSVDGRIGDIVYYAMSIAQESFVTKKAVATMSKKQLLVSSLALICVLATAIFAANKNFIPDVTFNGSALTGWHPLGQADWRADHGEIVGTPKGGSGGWLMLD